MMRGLQKRAWLLCCAMGVFTGAVVGSAAGQCDAWQDVGGGVDHSSPQVYGLGEYNGDLVIGGQFVTMAGGVTVNRIARWDSQDWHDFDGGMNGGVFVLYVWNGELIAGGEFTEAGGNSANRIARWDGSSWHALGTGLNDIVTSITEYNGDLIAGGYFTAAGGNSANGIARWDGTTWHTLDAGVADGAAAGRVWDVLVYNGELVAIGNFDQAGSVPANSIARWNGTGWQALKGGLTGASASDSYGLSQWNGDLIASGRFSHADGQSSNALARWDGADWHPLGGLVFGSRIWKTTVYEGDLIAGAAFGSFGDGVNFFQIARWDGSAWSGLGGGDVNSHVYNSMTFGGDLIVTGPFKDAAGVSVSGVALVCNCLCGACCVEGVCAEVPEQWCDEFGGVYHGDNSRCANVTSCAPTPPSCPADVNQDTVVNIFDLLEVLSAWGPCP